MQLAAFFKQEWGGEDMFSPARVCVSRAHTILQVGRVQVTRGRQSSFRH